MHNVWRTDVITQSLGSYIYCMYVWILHRSHQPQLAVGVQMTFSVPKTSPPSPEAGLTQPQSSSLLILRISSHIQGTRRSFYSCVHCRLHSCTDELAAAPALYSRALSRHSQSLGQTPARRIGTGLRPIYCCDKELFQIIVVTIDK